MIASSTTTPCRLARRAASGIDRVDPADQQPLHHLRRDLGGGRLRVHVFSCRAALPVAAIRGAIATPPSRRPPPTRPGSVRSSRSTARLRADVAGCRRACITGAGALRGAGLLADGGGGRTRGLRPGSTLEAGCFPPSCRIMDRWSPRESQKLEAATQLVVMPNDGFGLQRVGGVGQLEFDCDPFSQLKFGRQHRGHAAFAEIERAPGNAGRQPGAQHGDIHRNGHRVTRNAAADSAEARCRVSRSAHSLARTALTRTRAGVDCSAGDHAIWLTQAIGRPRPHLLPESYSPEQGSGPDRFAACVMGQVFRQHSARASAWRCLPTRRRGRLAERN